jgi:hypothetical protein
VWLGPTIGVVLGAILVTLLLRAWRAPRPAAARLTPTVDTDVADEFSRFRQEVGR